MVIDVEAEFRRLVAVARVLPNRFEAELAANQSEPAVHIDDFPAVTAIILAHWASVQYESAVALLDDSRTTHACMLLLRGLLEIWADFLYLTDKPDAAERRIRAIQTEILAMQQVAHTLKTPGFADSTDAEQSVQFTEERLEHLEEIKRLEEWTATGRRYGQVEQWLDKSGLEWPTPMYRGFSDAAHHRVPQWASEPGNEPTWHLRGVRLEQCVVIYGNVGRLALDLAQPNPDGSFAQSVEELLHDRALWLALHGHLD
jgi:hypothetical protein